MSPVEAVMGLTWAPLPPNPAAMAGAKLQGAMGGGCDETNPHDDRRVAVDQNPLHAMRLIVFCAMRLWKPGRRTGARRLGGDPVKTGSLPRLLQCDDDKEKELVKETGDGLQRIARRSHP
jgi:hypothetical protein